jgi:hypothetical protein
MRIINGRCVYELLREVEGFFFCIHIRPLLIVEVCKMLLLFGKYAYIILQMPSNVHGLSRGYKETLT